MVRKADMILGFTVVAALLLVCTPPARAQSGDRSHALITEKIDETAVVTQSGSTRPELRIARDLGPVSDSLQMSHMFLQMKISPQQNVDVEGLVNQLHDPASAEYHKWLSLAEIEERFGPAEEDIKTVSSWLESHGFTVNSIYRANGVIDFSGPASSVREAFHTAIHDFDVNGARHIANVRDARFPAALAPAVHGVTSMNDFRPRTLVHPRKEFTYGSPATYELVPGDLATIYDINPVYKAGISGKGQTIVVVEDTDIYSAADWNTFRATFGLNTRFPSGSLSQVHPQASGPGSGGSCADPGANSDDFEAAVDMEWASAAAPGAAIVVAACADTNTNFGGYIAMQNMLTSPAPPPGLISISYGESESQLGASFNAYINALYRLAVLRGVSVYVAAGDSGADSDDQFAPAALSGLNMSGYATTPNNVAVGGTDFEDTFLNENSTYWNAANGPFFASAKSYVPEIPWNDSCAGQLLSTYSGFATPYGANGFCNNPLGEGFLLDVAAGSGGPSGCAFGTPAIYGIVNGTCSGYPKPVYQYLAAGIPHDGVRDIPDITMFAADGYVWDHYYVVCYSDPTPGYYGLPCVTGQPELWEGGGGTSFGAPIMAGVQALVNESVGTQFEGNPNYVYYALNAAQNASVPPSQCDASLGNKVNPLCIYHDVTIGDIDVNCLPDPPFGTFNCYIPSGTNGVLSLSNNAYKPAYVAKPGFDLTSGMGSVNVFNLVRSWPGSIVH